MANRVKFTKKKYFRESKGNTSLQGHETCSKHWKKNLTCGYCVWQKRNKKNFTTKVYRLIQFTYLNWIWDNYKNMKDAGNVIVHLFYEFSIKQNYMESKQSYFRHKFWWRVQVLGTCQQYHLVIEQQLTGQAQDIMIHSNVNQQMQQHHSPCRCLPFQGSEVFCWVFSLIKA